MERSVHDAVISAFEQAGLLQAKQVFNNCLQL